MAHRRRRRRRRGRFGFLYMLLSAVLILGAVVAGSIVFFRVEEIVITGNAVYTDAQILSAAGVEQGDNLLLAGQPRRGQAILDQLPYLDSVNIHPDLPNTLVITLTECVPVGVVEGSEGIWWVVDSGCKLLEQGEEGIARALPRVTGLTALLPSVGSPLAVPVEENDKLAALKELLAALAGRDMLELTQSIDLSDSAEIHMEYEGRFLVHLPLYSEDFPLLAHTLQEAAAYLDGGQTGTIDMTGELPRFIPN